MTRESFVVLLGLFIFTIPFLGVPRSYTETILVGVGVLLMVTGYSLRRSAFLRSLEQENGERRADAFVESVVPEMTEGEERQMQ